MIVELYNTYDDRRKLNKNISKVAEIECTIKNSLSRNEPVIVLAEDYEANYCKLDGKYYFLVDKYYEIGHRKSYYLSTDVLMTYRDEIINSYGIRIRSSMESDNVYLRDDMANVMENKCYTEVKNFPYGFNEDGEWILVTVGGDTYEVQGA